MKRYDSIGIDFLYYKGVKKGRNRRRNSLKQLQIDKKSVRKHIIDRAFLSRTHFVEKRFCSTNHNKSY